MYFNFDFPRCCILKLNLCNKGNPLDCYFDKHIPGDIYLLKVNNRNTRGRCEICSMLTIKTPK